MVAPAIVAAGISAVSSLFGGRKAAKEQARAIAAQNAYNSPSAIRARAEEAGFNPLLFVGPGVGTQTALAQPVMGQAIANAGLAIANGVSEWEEQRAQATALEKQNAELRKALETATIRPKVAGVWPSGVVAVPQTPAGIDQTVMTGKQTKIVGGDSPATTPGAKPVLPIPSRGPGAGLPMGSPPNRFPTVIDLTGRIEDPTPLWQGYEDNGEVVWVPEGPDADELATGLAMAHAMGEKRRKNRDMWFTTEFWKFDPNKRDGYYRAGPYSGG